MKKVIILSMAIGALSFASCKKAYSCECKTEVSGGGSSISNTVSEQYSEKMKEDQAKSSCDATKKIVENQAKKDWDGSGASVSTSCTIK